jgi:hypothetical protein
VVGGVEQDFVQAAPIKDFATFCTPREVLFFFGRELFVFVECHRSGFCLFALDTATIEMISAV